MGNILCEIDRRCVELTHPIPTDKSKVLSRLITMRIILEHTETALQEVLFGGEDLSMLETVNEIISKIRIKEHHEDEKAEGAREEAR